MQKLIEDYIKESSRVKLTLLSQTETILKIAQLLVEVSKNGGEIVSCGNGGSACDAIHFTEELVARYLRERPGIRARHLCDPGILTCWGNDYSFDGVFQRQVEALMTSRDALVVFTTSGNSKNVLLALEAARKIGVKTVALLGKGGGKAKDLADLSCIVDSDVTSHIQESHEAIMHILCDIVERTLFFS
jgi:D-sedoheptulose 7-phosphate isomerase